MPRLKRARSRARCSSCSRIRIAQTSFGLSGRFCPVMRPLFQGVLFGRRDVCISPSMIASIEPTTPPSAYQLARTIGYAFVLSWLCDNIGGEGEYQPRCEVQKGLA